MNSNDKSSDSMVQLPDSEMTFVYFKLPGENKPEMWVQSDNPIYAISDLSILQDIEGFIFAPFNLSNKSPILFLQPDFIIEAGDYFVDLLKKKLSHSAFKDATAILSQPNKQHYLKNLESLIQKLQSGTAEKVVFSRTTVTKSLSYLQLFHLHNALCKAYPDAFVYLAHLPPYGIWMGATPETLISCHDNECTTMALAGTRKKGSQSEWGQKEREEQAIVSRYIQDVLIKHQIQNLHISNPFTKQAGVVEHLCTTFNFELSDQTSMLALVADLHPTPATCGIPKIEALRLIRQFENHNREYYTGFLGPINHHGKTALFVNLRCMKIIGSRMIIFAGGGITQDSVPEKEWEETELKTRTLLSVIEKMRG